MSPVLCLITDRRRFGIEAHALVQRVAAAARAGVHLVQIRERDLEGAALLRLVERCVAAVNGTRTRVIVNDRVDVAIAARAHGVHLRSDSVPAGRVRRIAPPGFLVGRSIHSSEEAQRVTREGGLDYLIFGTVFPTASKPEQRPSGADALAAAASATPLPVLAIGGVTADTACVVARSGAAGLAAIGLFNADGEEALRMSVSTLMAAFDTSRTSS